MATCWNVITGLDQPHVADASQRHQPLAVLRWLLGIRLVELPLGLRQLAKILLDQRDRLRFVEPARDHQQAIIGLIEFAIEILQLLDRHGLDVGPVADRALAIVVPIERRRHQPLIEQRGRVVLADLELVADHRHLRQQVLVLHVAVDQAIGFEIDGEFEILLAGRQRLVVIRAIDRSRAVEVAPRSIL